MPKKQVTDPITDQEIAFARLVLSGTMTDRRAAEVAGLNPDTAAYTKSKPRVRAYMLEHRTAVNEQLVDEDVDQHRRLNQTRERLLARLWEIAGLDAEKTRGNMSGQVKALSLIATIEGLIPNRRPVSAPNKPAHPPVTADIYQAAWLRKQRDNEDSPPEPTGQESVPEPQSASGSADPRLQFRQPLTLPDPPISPATRVPRKPPHWCLVCRGPILFRPVESLAP
jgi:hypothetical protein